jgi:ferredoxin
MLPDLPDDIGERVSRLPGVEVSVLEDRCTGCGLCSESCFVNALRIDGGKCSIDDSACRGCGRCADACPHDAIVVSVSEVSVKDAADRLCQIVDIESDREQWRSPSDGF